jgi:hypothetical protein
VIVVEPTGTQRSCDLVKRRRRRRRKRRRGGKKIRSRREGEEKMSR